MIMDTRYRDICVAGADLPKTAFDIHSSELKKEIDDTSYSGSDINSINDIVSYYSSSNRPPSLYDQRYTGVVLGAKPTGSQCMPMRDTPLVPTHSGDPNLAFAFYMNMDDTETHDAGLVNARAKDIYGATNYYKNESFFMDGISSCPGSALDYFKQPEFLRHTIPERFEFRRFQANWCYKYFVLSHDNSPWFTMERPGIGTDDPLSKIDPERSFLNNCQPLVNGEDARKIEFGDKKYTDHDKKVGYSPVRRYDFNDALNGYGGSGGGYSSGDSGKALDTHNEDEFLLADGKKESYEIVQHEWDKAFLDIKNGRLAAYPQYTIKPEYRDMFKYKFPKVSLPCREDKIGPVGKTGLLPPPSEAPPKHPGSKPNGPSCGYGSYTNDEYYNSYYDSYYDSCPKPHFPLPPDYQSMLPPITEYYCPNVEKITVPAENPFIPRNDIVGTDRGYSDSTSICIQDPTQCNASKTYFGYTDWNGVGECPGSGDHHKDWKERNEYPVECAIVPVDILSFRAQAFNSCIMQRINFNLNKFIELWIETGKYPDPAHADGSGFNPPCKTRFFENDTYAECPVKLSIQQCCHIIVKDVVPANFVKLRTKEGLRQARLDCKDNPATNPVTHEPSDHLVMDYNGYDASSDTFPGGKPALHLSMKGTEELNNCSTGNNTEPQEYMFSHYFESYSEESDYCGDECFLGYHMPYMRWWDTGVAAGNLRHGGDFINTLGGFDTLIGIGREEITKKDVKDAQDEAYYSGSSDDYGYGGDPGVWTRLDIHERSAEMGRIGGLPELYAHAMWSIRKDNNFCLARYEKSFKLGSADNFVLAKAGSGYTSRGDASKKIVPRPWAWSLGWRGYVTAWESTSFPDLFGPADGAVLIKDDPANDKYGLDNAKSGDIIVFNIPDKPPQIAFITNAQLEGYESLQFVDVEFWDQGKYPTSTGSSIMLGMGPERRIYKTEVPEANRQEVCNTTMRVLTKRGNDGPDYYSTGAYGSDICANSADDNLDSGTCMSSQCQPACLDSDYHVCVLGGSLWQSAKIYRRIYDVRQCSGTPTFDGNTTYSSFDLPTTYNWWWGDPDSPSAIYQDRSDKVDGDLWAHCVNKGYDPPPHWSPNFKFSGNLTGQQMQLFFCGPKWGNCSQAVESSMFFPRKAGEE